MIGRLVKYVPDWFPGAGFKKQAKEWNKVTTATAEEPFAYIKEQAVCLEEYITGRY